MQNQVGLKTCRSIYLCRNLICLSMQGSSVREILIRLKREEDLTVIRVHENLQRKDTTPDLVRWGLILPIGPWIVTRCIIV